MTPAPDDPSTQDPSHHPSRHLSFLVLDRAVLRDAPPAVTAHLAECDSCRTHVATAAPVPAAVPLPDLALVKKTLERRRRIWRRWSWGGGGFVTAAAACAVVLVAGAQRDRPTGGHTGGQYLGSKGFPSVWIYVKNDAGLELWDGKKALTSGDRLRMKVDPGHHDRVQVYALRAGDKPAQLYGGKIAPGQSTILPDAWEIDALPGPERLFVVLANRDVVPAWERWLRGEIEPGVSLLPFILPKSVSNSRPASDDPAASDRPKRSARP
jgi:hypothetical protein